MNTKLESLIPDEALRAQVEAHLAEEIATAVAKKAAELQDKLRIKDMTHQAALDEQRRKLSKPS